MWQVGLYSLQTHHKPVTHLTFVLNLEICFVLLAKVIKEASIFLRNIKVFYNFEHSTWSSAILLKPQFTHLKQESVHKIYITAHVIIFFLCMHGNCWAYHFSLSLCLSPPSPSLCFYPGWEWSQWAESTDAFSQCYCGKLPFPKPELGWMAASQLGGTTGGSRMVPFKCRFTGSCCGTLKAKMFWMTLRKV